MADLHVSRLVADLVADPGNVPDLVVLEGWLGPSARDGFWRVYTAPELDEYYEVAEGDVVRSEDIEAGVVLGDIDLTGATRLWVRRAADWRYVPGRREAYAPGAVPEEVPAPEPELLARLLARTGCRKPCRSW